MTCFPHDPTHVVKAVTHPALAVTASTKHSRTGNGSWNLFSVVPQYGIAHVSPLSPHSLERAMIL